MRGGGELLAPKNCAIPECESVEIGMQTHEKQKRSEFSLEYQPMIKTQHLMKLVSKSLKLLKSKTYSKKKCFFPWRFPKMLLGHTASDSKRVQYRNVSVSRWTIWWCYTLRDELLDTPEAFEEHEALADILRNSLNLATANL